MTLPSFYRTVVPDHQAEALCDISIPLEFCYVKRRLVVTLRRADRKLSETVLKRWRKMVGFCECKFGMSCRPS